MDFAWEFFEDLDESVYVSDLETYDLIYMNARLRNSHGFSSHDNYLGKKCYKVLQGIDSPCSFCTNHALKPGKFVSWTHKNPVLGKCFLLKDTLVSRGQREYRLEIAIDADAKSGTAASYYYSRNETILNGCLHQFVSATNPEDSIRNVLAYIGNTFLCDRAYVFEINDNDLMSNTYEWCADGITPQKDVLQNESIECIDWWMSLFRENKVVVIEDLEEIRLTHPLSYAVLKPQDVSSLTAGPIRIDDQVLGFIGVDNPNSDMLPLIAPLLNIIGYFFVSLLRRRDLLRRLNHLSFHDSLTGAFNRNAMAEHHASRLQMHSIGVVYCDVTGLKQTNDTMGHDAGDRMIQSCYHLIHDTLRTHWVYRAGGDEFVSVCPDCTESDFLKRVQLLRDRIHQGPHHMAVGYTWSDQQPVNLEALISQADKIMYQDKRDYYTANLITPGIERRRSSARIEIDSESSQSLFHQFLKATCCDAESLFQSISQQNTSSYFFFGDMQKDLFYISDNMRDDFGFESNIVPSMLLTWSKHISSPKFRELYHHDFMDMIQKKRTIHDLRYQVRTVSGKNIWVRCYGILKWDAEKQTPLFFSGRITHQDNEFIVDPITNFPRASAALSRLEKMQASEKQCLAIGFSLNNITALNCTRGRSYSDRLLKNIADKLTDTLSEYMSFYRLEGMRCLALVVPDCPERKDTLVQKIRDVIESCYQGMGIPIHRTCSFGLMEYPYPRLTLKDFLEHMISVIKIAKREGIYPYLNYSPSTIQRIRQISEMELALNQDVLNGMEHFRTVIQPVVSAADGKLIGGEVLLRWTFNGKDIPPSAFIPMLEKSDMIHLAGRWIFQQAVRSCARLITYVPDFFLTFNVSLLQLADIHFPDIMKETLEMYHLDGSHLVAEMTESCLDEHPETVQFFVDTCKNLGMQIALDDFGSGYSSLQMLLRYPTSIIKLDRSLMQEITQSEEKLQFVRSIVYACHQFGKKVWAEGVETTEQNTIVRNTGCDVIQGYYYYRPTELHDLYRLLSAL